MTFTRTRALLVLLLLAGATAAHAVPIVNQGDGSSNGTALDTARARVTLERISSVVTSALAEIAPNQVSAGSPANAFVYDILPTIGPADSGVRSIDITAPPGYSNLAVSGVSIGGVPFASACPTPGAGQYCASVAGPVLTVTLGAKVTTTLTDLRVLFTADAPAAVGTADFTSSVADGPLVRATDPGNADGDAADANSIAVEVIAAPGLVLSLSKAANKTEALIGEVVTYIVEIRNTVTRAIDNVRVSDSIPPNFRYVAGSARLDGVPIPDPTGNRPAAFAIGTVPALVDGNGNGTADPGEPGYRVLLYQLVVGSGARPGAYVNTAVAIDLCPTCVLSNPVSAQVDVRLDPVFDLGTIIGKVFDDHNADGRQQPDEAGVAGAFVALDDGTYALTDEYGRYHFPAVRPGHRMVKIDLQRLPPGASATKGDSVVLWATPGLMLTADFGVTLHRETERIGDAGAPGVAVRTDSPDAPVTVRGNVEDLSIVVNGSAVPIPATDVQLTRTKLEAAVRLRGNRLEAPARFTIKSTTQAPPAAWALVIEGAGRDVAKRIEGTGNPPATVDWDGVRTDGRRVTAAEVYTYQLELRFADGSTSTSARRLFGVDRTNITSIQLTGEAFETGKAILSPKAQKVLDGAAATIRKHPGEKIVIEGHTDWVGSNAANMALSKARAESAYRYLTEQRGLARDQFVLAWYGEDRPVASNDTDEGRALNRRVVLEGEIKDTDGVHILDAFREPPEVRIDGSDVPVDERGRFGSPVAIDPTSKVNIVMRDAAGRSVHTAVPLPTVMLSAPAGERLLAYGASDDACAAARPAAKTFLASETAATCRLRGATEPGNQVEIDGRAVVVDAGGAFSADLPLRLGLNTVGVVVRSPEGLLRVANLATRVADKDEQGALLVATSGVANLAVDLPPLGTKLHDPRLEVRGTIDPGGTVTLNGVPATVAPNGTFVGVVELPRGQVSQLEVKVQDVHGRVGAITREMEVAKHQLFLMAFGEGTIGRLKSSGYLEGAGSEQPSEYWSEGRVAYYLKGVISGKYLVTSAFDSAKTSDSTLFGSLDAGAQERLLTNLDPEKYYPVYGDDSTVVYDAQSHGKFYLAVDSDVIHAVVGDFPMSLSDTELAAYRRTLYGGRFVYQSASKTSFGDPDTQVVVFGADLKHAHVRDELRATGGSLYYLSRRDVIEGSEEVTIVVRDKNTGLQLTSQRQRQNLDYFLKYEEGRLLFQRPIASVVAGGSIVDQAALAGNPVSIYVDYEVVLDSFDKTASGGRVRQQLGDRVAVGGTYVRDEAVAGAYELKGLDAEVRMGQNSRFVVEAADSSGADALAQVSEDGGLTYTAAQTSAFADGSAFKAAADLDVGEWFGKPNRYRLRTYFKDLDPGFSSSGNLQEQGSRKLGVEAVFDVSASDSIRVRHDRDEQSGGAALLAAQSESSTSAAQWTRTKQRWGIVVELFDSESKSATTTIDRTYGAAHFWAKVTEKLTARFEHQQTISGPDNDQTSAGVQYQALPNLALEVLAADGTAGSSAQAGAVYTVGQSSIYLSERRSDSGAGDATTTVLGARSPIGRGSRVYTEYQWEDSDSGGRTISLLGIQQQWDPTPGLRFLLSGERADASSASGETDRSALIGGFSYANADGWHASSRQEFRWDSGAVRTRQYFTINELDYRIHPDFTVLARFRYSRTEDRNTGATGARIDERVLGFAYRPVRSDRFNALFKYTSLLDQRPLQVAGDVRTIRRSDVLAVDTSLRIGARFEWITKEATRMMDESVADLPSVRTNTWLFVQRLNFQVWKAMSLAGEYRTLSQREADDVRQGWLAEAMWEFTKGFGAGVGYNFTDFSDDVFSTNDYQVQGWFFRVQARY